MINWILSKIVCPACLGLRFGPGHLIFRMTGLCDGENGW